MPYKHGLSNSPEHIAWQRMKQRCYDPHDKRYARYGGRGIRVCAEWRDDFLAFLRAIGPRPTPKHSLDRINNDGDYAPENCRWATAAEQARNRGGDRANVWLTHAGVTLCVVDWARRTGLTRQQIENRLRKGWTAERALTEPIHTNKRSHTKAGWMKPRH